MTDIPCDVCGHTPCLTPVYCSGGRAHEQTLIRQKADGLGEWDAGEIDDSQVPPRGWLLGNVFCRGYVSSLLADGGTGKSATRMAQLMAVATGKELTGEHVFHRSRVLILALEDDNSELKRRLRACRLYHQISREELQGWMFLAAPGNAAGKLLRMERNSYIDAGLSAHLERIIVKRKIDIISLDPFVKAHAVNENDNNAIDAVMQILINLCTKYDICIDAPHHQSKGAADPGNPNKGRGASSMKDAARLVYTLVPMTKEEALAMGLSEEFRRSLIRMDNAKINFCPPAVTAKWFRLVGVPIGNKTELYPAGDNVQTIEPWSPPDKWENTSIPLLNRILTQIDNGLPDGQRYSAARNALEQHSAWGVILAHIPNKSEALAKSIVRAWLDTGLLIQEPYHNPKTRKTVTGLRVDHSKRPT